MKVVNKLFLGIISSFLSNNPVLLLIIYLVGIILYCIYINITDKKLNYVISTECQLEILMFIIETMLKTILYSYIFLQTS